MSDRKSLVSTLWIASSLVLLASVLVAPIRISGASTVTVSAQPDCFHPHLAQLADPPTTRLNAATTTDAVPQVNALPSDTEEQDRADPLDEPRVSFLIPRSFRKDPDRQVLVPRSILSHYPLRC